MSYPLWVYGSCPVSVGQVEELVRRLPGVQPVVCGDFVQAWSEDGRLHFDVNPAMTMDRIDMPDDIELPEGEVWMVELDAQTVNDTAEQFAQMLAGVMAGVACDDAGVFWPERAAVPTEPVAPVVQTPARQLELYWFGVWGEGCYRTRAILQLCEQWFPSAMPRRYGEYWPYEHRFSDGGLEALLTCCDKSDDGGLGFTCAEYPFMDGVVVTSSGLRVTNGSWQFTLYGVADAFVEEGVIRQLEGFLVSIADQCEAVYAYAEVCGGYTWDGKKLASYGNQAEWYPPVWSGGVWRKCPAVGLLGVTPYPTWLTWFGGEYVSLLDDWLSRPKKQWLVRRTETGVMMRLADVPATRAQLEGPLGRVFGSGWVPSRFVSRKWQPARVRVSGSR